MEEKVYLLQNFGVTVNSLDEWNRIKDNSDLVGNSFEDLSEGKCVRLSDDQLKFYLDNKNYSEFYSSYNWYYMKPVDVNIMNDNIKEEREREYRSDTDKLYMAYIKYKEFGETEKANKAYDIWKAEVQKIKENNPYII